MKKVWYNKRVEKNYYKNILQAERRKGRVFMKFVTLVNGAEKSWESIDSNLRAGQMIGIDAGGHREVLVSEEDFQNKVDRYVDNMVNHGVRAFIFAYELKKAVHYVRVTPAQVKKNAFRLYSFNTDGKFLSLTFRATKVEIECLQEIGVEILEVEAEEFLAVQNEASNGYKAEVLLYGRSQHKTTYSDGKSLNLSGKLESTQLKSSCRNRSRSRSKTHNIWSARFA